ncbi:MAG: dTDP-4-dehydrorhamnose reductase [Hyphomonadaceae bacterium]
MTRTILILGRSGQLAQALFARPAPDGFRWDAWGRETLDLARDDVEARVRAAAPAAVINAAAHTGVDRAESEPEAAFALNRDAPGALARAAAALGAPFVHISTDYVFDGTKPSPYTEEDPLAPLGVYGRSKAEGEALVRESGGRAAIIRTSWVYARAGANFVNTMLRLSEARDEINVVADQIGRPTWARDLADACVGMTERLLLDDARAEGVFHYSGAGDATWADFAEAIFAAARRPVRVKRITTEDYPTPAARPKNSRLDCSKIAALGIQPRPWREALALCIGGS